MKSSVRSCLTSGRPAALAGLAVAVLVTTMGMSAAVADTTQTAAPADGTAPETLDVGVVDVAVNEQDPGETGAEETSVEEPAPVEPLRERPSPRTAPGPRSSWGWPPRTPSGPASRTRRRPARTTR